MAKIKKDTINREAFEKEMDEIKNLIHQNTDPEVIILAINNVKNRLTEYIDERDAEPFHISEWMNRIN